MFRSWTGARADCDVQCYQSVHLSVLKHFAESGIFHVGLHTPFDVQFLHHDQLSDSF